MGDTEHPDCEAGFVTSVDRGRGIAWCRYWRAYTMELRTKANSEMTRINTLVVEETVPQDVIDRKLKDIEVARCKACRRDCRTAWPSCEREGL